MSSGLSATVHSFSSVYFNNTCVFIIYYYLPIYLWKELNILNILMYILQIIVLLNYVLSFNYFENLLHIETLTVIY